VAWRAVSILTPPGLAAEKGKVLLIIETVASAWFIADCGKRLIASRVTTLYEISRQPRCQMLK